MTEVEFSRLLTKLTDTAAKLNQASDSINTVIERLEDKLHEWSIGIEVWFEDTPLVSVESREDTEEDDSSGNTIYRRVSHDTQLGYARVNGEWRLAIRQVTYEAYVTDRWEFVEASDPSRLRDASRNLRIKALKQVPALFRTLDEAATAAITAIEDAKKLV